MRILIFKVVLSFCASIFILGGAFAQPNGMPETIKRVTSAGSYIVAFRLSSKSLHGSPPFSGAKFLHNLGQHSGLIRKEWLGEDLQGTDPLGFGVLGFSSSREGQRYLSGEVSAGRVAFFEEDGVYDLSEELGESSGAPTGGGASKPWWHEGIRLPANPGEGTRLREDGSQPASPLIAVFDSGIDGQHPALAGRIWKNPQPGSAGCLNDEWGCHTAGTSSDRGYLGDGNAYPFGTGGFAESCPRKFYGDYSRPDGNCFHATHIAGIIAGICPGCQLINIKVVSSQGGSGKVLDSSLLKGFKYLANLQRRHGLPLIIANLSFGKRKASKSFSIFLHALERQGAQFLIIAAAGNEDQHRPVYPAAEAFAMGVSALSRSGKKAKYSNFGTWVSIAAPGGDLASEGLASSITSAVPGGGTEVSQGTSMATPMVSAVAGLILLQNPALSSGAVRSRILQSAQGELYSESFAEGFNRRYFFPRLRPSGKRVPLLGIGSLDAAAALAGISKQRDDSLRKDRIKPLCGAVGGGGHSSNHGISGVLLLLLALLAPVFHLVYLSNWRKKTIY